MQDKEESRLSEGGLAKPDAVEQERKAFARVIAVGSEIKQVVPGDRIVYGLYAGETIETKDNDGKPVFLKLLHADDYIGIDQGDIEVDY